MTLLEFLQRKRHNFYRDIDAKPLTAKAEEKGIEFYDELDRLIKEWKDKWEVS